MTIERLPADGVARWIHVSRPAAELADRIAGTEFVPGALRGNAPAVAACIMYGDEIGVGPMTALQGVHIIDGRPFMSAELMRALVLAAGHVITVVESSGTRCFVQGRRRTPDGRYSEPVSVEWTIEMARAAGLAGRGAWRTYPRALLLARASADLCRSVFADVVRGLGHIPESPDAADVSDWAEYAESLGPESETPAPVKTETVQWDPRALIEPVEGKPLGVPWEADAEDVPTAARPPMIGLPEDDDEPTPAEDPRARLVTEEQITRIMAAYGDLPFGSDRTLRLALFSVIVGREIESTKELERMESMRLLGALHDLRTGRTIATDDGHGRWTIHAGAEPPEDE